LRASCFVVFLIISFLFPFFSSTFYSFWFFLPLYIFFGVFPFFFVFLFFCFLFSFLLLLFRGIWGFLLHLYLVLLLAHDRIEFGTPLLCFLSIAYVYVLVWELNSGGPLPYWASFSYDFYLFFIWVVEDEVFCELFGFLGCIFFASFFALRCVAYCYLFVFVIRRLYGSCFFLVVFYCFPLLCFVVYLFGCLSCEEMVFILFLFLGVFVFLGF